MKAVGARVAKATMHGNDDFARWHQGYLQRFPPPARHSVLLEDHTIETAGCRELASEGFTHEHVFTREELVGYLKTQSNVSAALAAGAESDATATWWLMSTLEPLFAGVTATFGFSGVLSLYRVDHDV